MNLSVLSVAYPFAPVGPDAVGGAEQIVAAIDAALVQAGHRSVVIAPEGSRVAGELVTVPATTDSVEDAVRKRVWAQIRSALESALLRWPVDVIHLHGVDFYEYLPAAGPTLVTLHLPLSWYPERAWRRRAGLRFNCVSAAQQREGVPPVDLLPPIPNGIPVEALSARHAKRKFALMLARICPEKGIHLGLDAARRANAPCLIGGDIYPYDVHRRYFRDKVEPRLGRQARFLGRLDFARKRRFLTAARCLLIPSLAAETASLVAMEAAACGTPAIAFPNGALGETIEHGRTGYLVGDVAEMADAIAQAGEVDSNLCRRVARERFSLPTMIEGYFSAYRGLAGTGPGAQSGGVKGDLQAVIVDDGASLEALAEDWWGLWRRSQASPFQSPAWLIPWWRSFHPGRLCAIALRQEGRLVGLAPLYAEEGNAGSRLLPIGISVSDYLDLLVEPCGDLVAAKLGSAALALSIPWDRLELEELPPEAAARSMPCPAGCRDESLQQSVCPVLILPASTDELASRCSHSKRANLTLGRNRAKRRGGIEFRTVDAGGIARFLNDLVRLHGARWEGRGESGAFSDPRVIEFHRQAAPLLHDAGLARFFLATIEGNAAAAIYALLRGDRLFSYLTGFDPRYSFESPGELLLAHVIETAVQQGMREFHFLRGREAYKYSWQPVERINLKRSFIRVA